jgi:hypothetical protein
MPSRSEDTHRSCNHGIMPFVLGLLRIMGANAVIMVRFAPLRYSIGADMAPIALIMPVTAAV